MYNLYYYQFNNYYNRQYKAFDRLEDYGPPLGSLSANFEYGDGVNTADILQHVSWNTLAGVPDYLVVTDTADNILSRWFVIEAVKINGAQYRVFFRRDLLADFHDIIVSSPAFIEKASLRTTDPLIWNSENMTYNQIKKGELELKDNTKTPWVVGYYALKGPEDDQSSGPVSVGIAEYDIDEEVNGITNYTYYGWTQKSYYYLTKAELQIDAWFNRGGGECYQFHFFPETNGGYYSKYLINYNDRKGYMSGFGANGDSALEALRANFKGKNLQQQFINTVLTIDGITEAQLATLQKQAYKIIKDTATDKIYKVNVQIKPDNNWFKPNTDMAADPKYKTIYNLTNNTIGQYIFNTSSGMVNPVWGYNITQNEVIFSLDEITPTNGHFINIDSSRRTLNDAPYCMFCIPYGEINVRTTDGADGVFTTNKANALTIGAGLLANKKDFVYDVSILPFCPIEKVRRLIGITNTIDVRELTDAVDYTTSAFEIDQIIFWADSSQGSFDISINDLFTEYTKEQFELMGNWFSNYDTWDPIETKVVSECSMYRLCSPNYASSFEYNIAKNAGINNTSAYTNPYIFHVDYGYKPFNPYIRVAPMFGGLYGTNFNDARGLILSGDFSITAITDKWQEYQLQNKNYQLAFDRQIENMEVQNKYGRIQDIANVITGTAMGAVQGGMTGAMTGNPTAAKAGATAAGVASLVGGIADLNINRNLRNEALDFTKDNFGFALGNIKALPYTLNKVSAINPNFRFFPILEIYDATEEEKNALRQKIKYNGMTVGRINTISAYVQEEPTYIKAQLIRIEGVQEDTHLLNEIANEANKGWYL